MISVETRSIKSRFVWRRIGRYTVCVCTFQPRNFTGWGSKGVKHGYRSQRSLICGWSLMMPFMCFAFTRMPNGSCRGWFVSLLVSTVFRLVALICCRVCWVQKCYPSFDLWFIKLCAVNMLVFAGACVCVCACVRACVCVCVRECVRACVCVRARAPA